MNYIKIILGFIAILIGLKSIFTDSTIIGSMASFSAALFFAINAWDSYKSSNKKNGLIYIIVTILLILNAVVRLM